MQAACALLASALHRGHGVARDPSRPGALRRACDAGEPRGCLGLAELTRDGLGGAARPGEGGGAPHRACDAGIGAGCYELALLMARGQGATRDLAQATTLLRDACTDGDPRGCVQLGALFQKGGLVRRTSTAPRPSSARPARWTRSPAAAASAAMLESGDTVTQNLPEAKALCARTCDEGVATDCYRLARIVKRENPRPTRETFILFSKACDGDVALACHEVGLAWESARDPMKALPFYEKACEGEVNAACTKVRRLEP